MSLAERSPLYAARLNAFRIGAQAGQGRNAVTTRDLIERASSAGLTAADLNYPDHFQDEAVAEIGGALQASGMEPRTRCPTNSGSTGRKSADG